MSRWGISGQSVPGGLLYSDAVNRAASDLDFPPLFIYAVCCRESIIGEMNGKWTAATVVSADGGHGLAQLTSSYPPNWQDPYANARYAIADFLLPDVQRWRQELGVAGDDLIRCTAASYNAGFGGAWQGHVHGDVDKYTTGRYGAGVLALYHTLLSTGKP